MRPLAVFLALAVVIFLRLGAAGVIDYDEAAYSEVSRTMVLSGDWVTPTQNGEDFFEKPAFIYWTQALGFQLFGINAFGARFFNALAALTLALSLYLLARQPLGENTALLSAVIFGTSLEPMALARVTLTDTWLTLWLVLSLGFFFRASQRHFHGSGGRGDFLLACCFSGLAMLTKGAIGFLLPAGAVLLWILLGKRSFFFMRPSWLIPGLLLLGGIGCSWYLLLGFTHSGGFGFMGELFWDHHVGRFLGAKQGHSGPFYYYLPVLLVGTLPWSPFVALALWRKSWRFGDDSASSFLLLFLLFAALTFVFFSIAATKLPNYVGPVFPAAALLTANFFTRGTATESTAASKWAATSVIALLGVVAIFFGALPTVLDHLPQILGDKAQKMPGLLLPIHLGAAPYWIAAVLLIGGWRVGSHLRRERLSHLPRTLAVTFAVFFTLLWIDVFPRYDAHFAEPLREASRIAARHCADSEPTYLIGLRHKPSVIFYGGNATVYVSRKSPESIATLFGPDPRIAITTEYYLQQFVEPHKGSGEVEILARCTGYVVVRCERG